MGTVTTRSLRWASKEGRFVWGEEGGRPIGVERLTAASTDALGLSPLFWISELLYDDWN
jgi:hypothetical protein